MTSFSDIIFDGTRPNDEIIADINKALEAGEDIDESRSGFTALARVPNETIAEYLLSKGAEIDARDDDGETALIKTSVANRRIFYFLLKSGADVNAQDKMGKTVLMRLVRCHEDNDLSRKIVDREDVKLNLVDKDCKTAMDYAIESENYDIFLYITGKIGKIDRKYVEPMIESLDSNRLALIEEAEKIREKSEKFTEKNKKIREIFRTIVENSDSVEDLKYIISFLLGEDDDE